MKQANYQWSVIGSGPAGIAAVSKLLENGVLQEDIAWIDPYFCVGDLGRLWPSVSGNTKVSLFRQFLEELPLYQEDPNSTLSQCPADETCDLEHVATPLLDVSLKLQAKVDAIKASVTELNKKDGHWQITTLDKSLIKSKRVILATGGTPLNFETPLPSIPLSHALNKSLLSKEVSKDSTIIVFGASHSAIIILKYLSELNVRKIINFYKKPCLYAQELDGHILFDNTGLKGQSAEWALEHIERQLPQNLERYHFNETRVAEKLQEADKTIAAIGFRAKANIHSEQYDLSHYDRHTGIIASGLFGFGLAYPEEITTHFGHKEQQVGLWKFMTYLERVLPIWLNYPT
jgi:thioredoxin reductase